MFKRFVMIKDDVINVYLSYSVVDITNQSMGISKVIKKISGKCTL
jgi:hypothetical protein